MLVIISVVANARFSKDAHSRHFRQLRFPSHRFRAYGDILGCRLLKSLAPISMDSWREVGTTTPHAEIEFEASRAHMQPSNRVTSEQASGRWRPLAGCSFAPSELEEVNVD